MAPSPANNLNTHSTDNYLNNGLLNDNKNENNQHFATFDTLNFKEDKISHTKSPIHQTLSIYSINSYLRVNKDRGFRKDKIVEKISDISLDEGCEELDEHDELDEFKDTISDDIIQ